MQDTEEHLSALLELYSIVDPTMKCVERLLLKYWTDNVPDRTEFKDYHTGFLKEGRVGFCAYRLNQRNALRDVEIAQYRLIVP